MQYSETAMKVYDKLYFRPGDDRSPHKVHKRVAKFASLGDVEFAARLTRWMDEGFMRPNTPTLMNAGYLPEPQTSACFVGDLRDDLRSILNFDLEAGLIYNKGSGIGGQYGNLREIGAPLSRGGCSSGPFAFLRKHAMTGWAIKSGGAARRAAAMGMMYDHHPDILEWIKFKAKNRDRIVINGEEVPLFDGVNLSVAASDAFMNSALVGESWDLVGVVDTVVKRTVSASDMLDMIAKNACECGDPGIWFIDRANADNTIPSCGRYDSTNPCGEQHLLPRQSCALASINLARFVQEEHWGQVFDWPLFDRVVSDVTTMQDNLIDVSGYPTPDYKKMAVETRPIGIGIMGLADALILLGIQYDSMEAYEFATALAKRLTTAVIHRSSILAAGKGPFPLYEENMGRVLDVASKFVDNNEAMASAKHFGLRNSQWTTIAPTGSIAISADCSQGMEPLFALCYGKRISDSNEVWSFVNPAFEKLYGRESWYEKALEEIAENHGSCKGCPSVPGEVQRIFRVAHDIKWQDRIKMQAALQSGISNGISSTINLPAGTTPDTVRDIYVEAWRSGLKGVTVYIDGSKGGQPVVFGGKTQEKGEVKVAKEEKSKPFDVSPLKRGEIVERPKALDGSTYCYRTGCGKNYVTVNHLGGAIMEAFANPSAGGGCQALIRGLGTVVSVAIRGGIDPALIANKLNKIICPSCRGKEVDVKSCPAAIAKAIMEFSKENGFDDEDEDFYDDYPPAELLIAETIQDFVEPTPEEIREALHNMDEVCSDGHHYETAVKNPCPDCGAELMPVEGCFTCRVCGFSRCS